MKKFVIGIILVYIFVSCKFFPKNTENKESSTYDLDVQWELETDFVFPSINYFQENENFYFHESDDMDQDNVADVSFNIAKVNLENGRYTWKTTKINSQIAGNESIQKIGDMIIVYDYQGKIFVFSDIDGELITTILLGYTNEERSIYKLGTSSIVFENTILWEVYTNDDNISNDGLVYLDWNSVDLSIDEQIIIPKYLWHRDEQNTQSVLNNIIQKDGILYFETLWDYKNSSYVYAIDIKAKELCWRTKTESMWGTGKNCLLVIDDKLYSIENRIACYDIFDKGKEIFEIEKDEKSGIYLGGYSSIGGITNNKGYLYYTTTSSIGGNAVGTPVELIKNIICIRASDLKLVWCDLDSKTGSLFSKVVVENEKAFVFCCDRLRVYDSKTGKLIGINDNIGSWTHQIPTTYNGNVIFFNTDRKTKTSVLTAIKA